MAVADHSARCRGAQALEVHGHGRAGLCTRVWSVQHGYASDQCRVLRLQFGDERRQTADIGSVVPGLRSFNGNVIDTLTYVVPWPVNRYLHGAI